MNIRFKSGLTAVFALFFIIALTVSGRATAKEEKMATIDDLNTLAPGFVQLTKETLFGDVWKRPELSARDKSLVTVTILASQNRLEQIDYHLGFALDNGLTEQELAAAMTQVAFYAGWPSAMTGLTHLKDVIDKRKAQKAESAK